MEIFRPFLDRNLMLTTFAGSGATSEAVFLASLNQLKHLALVFYPNFPEASHSCQWQHVRVKNSSSHVRLCEPPDHKITLGRRPASTSVMLLSAMLQTPIGNSIIFFPCKDT